MKNNSEDSVVPLAQKQSSVRHSKLNSSEASNLDLSVENFVMRILGGNNQRVLFYISLFFVTCSFLSWQIMGIAGKYVVTPDNEISSIWEWISSLCFFLYTMFLGLGLISAFVYLTRRF